MSEFDPTIASKILDSILGNGLSRLGDANPGSHLSELTKQGLLTADDAQALQALVAKAKSGSKASTPTILPQVDGALGAAKSEVAVTTLMTLRYILSMQPSAPRQAQTDQNLLSIPQIPYDPGAASEGCLEGATAGALVGAAFGSVPGAIWGAGLGGVMGGLVRGFGEGWGEWWQGSQEGGKK
jgi:hypothetical protein